MMGKSDYAHDGGDDKDEVDKDAGWNIVATVTDWPYRWMIGGCSRDV